MPQALRIPALLALALAAGLGFSGCLTEEDSSDPGDTIDVFPKPQGPKILPLEMETVASYRYAEFDDSGRALQRLPRLTLRIGIRGKDTFSYAFEDTGRGYLISYRDWGVRDSAGIYILGTFEGRTDTWYGAPLLWLPQFPSIGATWSLGAGRTLEAVAVDAPFYTAVLFPYDSEAPVVQGFQRHSAIHIKETAGGVVTHWWLRKGVGILGFQRNAGGRLMASGSLETIYSVRRYTHLW